MAVTLLNLLYPLRILKYITLAKILLPRDRAGVSTA